MTSNKEDYLKVIYQAGGMNTPVPNKVISEQLGVSPASVTEMLVKLSRQGLIKYEAYKGSTLTEEGLSSCISLVRSHRLWEVFLVRHLNYTWSEAHEDAHLLEHATPNRMLEKLNHFLNYPSYCPHGVAIPKSDGQLEIRKLCSLRKLKVGDTSIIRRVSEEKNLLDYLDGLGIEIGEPVRVISIGEYEGPYTVLIKENAVQISYKAVGQIFVDCDE